MICRFCDTQMERQDEFDQVTEEYSIVASQYLCPECGYNGIWSRTANTQPFRTKRGQPYGCWHTLYNPMLDPIVDEMMHSLILKFT